VHGDRDLARAKGVALPDINRRSYGLHELNWVIHSSRVVCDLVRTFTEHVVARYSTMQQPRARFACLAHVNSWNFMLLVYAAAAVHFVRTRTSGIHEASLAINVKVNAVS
jgi:hypothetical protein